MAWWTKAVLIFLSSFFLYSCSNLEEKESVNSLNKEKVAQDKSLETLHLIDSFFTVASSWNASTVTVLNEIGRAITSLDSSLTFYPYKDVRGNRSFTFCAERKAQFHVFRTTSFLSQTPVQSGEYLVWRKPTNGYLLLDISIAPHPILGWRLSVRKRSQE